MRRSFAFARGVRGDRLNRFRPHRNVPAGLTELITSDVRSFLPTGAGNCAPLYHPFMYSLNAAKHDVQVLA
jgi:hypothetical protein